MFVVERVGRPASRPVSGGQDGSGVEDDSGGSANGAEATASLEPVGTPLAPATVPAAATAGRADPAGAGAGATPEHPARAAESAPPPARRRHVWGLRPLTAIVALAALAVTGILAWLAATVHQTSEQHLLDLQVRQAAAAVGASLRSVQPQLADALQVQTDTDNPADFKRFAATKVGKRGGFASVSLWRLTPGGATMLAVDGAKPRLVTDHRATAFFARLRPDPTLQVTSILPGNPPAVGYAEYPPGEPPGDEFVAYSEGLLPSHRKFVVPTSSAFHDLNFALYLGPRPSRSGLIEASVPTPVQGEHATATAPFGNSALTIVATPTSPLSGRLSVALPWIVVGVGLALAMTSASAVEYVLRRRTAAEALAAENERLFVQQRDIAGTLQQALLADLPSPSDLDVAARYVPGVRGMDVGGDWYDVVCPADGRCLFVVGDVSGRGLQAATTMASLRFAARAYFVQGDRPRVVLSKLDHLLDIETHQQFATVLVGELDTGRRRLTLASAGHYPPVLVSGGVARLVEVPAGQPIGIDGPERPAEVTVDVPPGGLVLGFTDGLVERRGEHLDVSLTRLCDAAARAAATGSAEDAITGVAASLLPDGGEDDVVLLGLRLPQ